MRFDFDHLEGAQRYKLLTACVVPRPIAWVTSVNGDGIVNAAPFSFFNVMGHTPPTVVLGLLKDPDKGAKDTECNILENKEFVINLVGEAAASRMNETAVNAPRDVSEMEIAGLTSMESAFVSPPRIAEASASFECELFTAVVPGPDQTIIIGKILALHIDDRFVLDAQRCHIDTPALELIGRMHGRGMYAKSDHLFKLDRPTWQKPER